MRKKGIDCFIYTCLKLQEMLSFWVYFLRFPLGSTITHPIREGYTPPVLTHQCFAARKYQITKSQAFETKYYGHPSCYDLKIPEKYTKTIVYNHSADCPNLSAAKY